MAGRLALDQEMKVRPFLLQPMMDKFNIRLLYYDELSPKIKTGESTDVLLWNIVTLYYHEYFEVIDEMKKYYNLNPSIMTSYVNNCINFVFNDMMTFCNEHKIPKPRKEHELIPLPVDLYPIWFNNLEDYIADLTWGNKDKKIMSKEVLPKLLNSFEVYRDVIKTVDFSFKDSNEIYCIIKEILNTNQDKIESYKKGKTTIINVLFGEIMKKSGGKLNTKETKEILESELKKY